MELEDINHWWIEGRVREEFVPETRRDMFTKLRAEIKRKQIQVLTGLRRVGKSTLFYQLINWLIKNGTKPLNIFYCNFDEPMLQEKRIEELLKEYSKLTEVDYKRARIYLFLDEVQKLSNWVDQVKLIYDNFPNIKILVSGSASLNILSEAKKSLGGRAIYYELKPLSFPEYLHLKGIGINRKRFLLYREVLEKEFEKFLIRPFPELIHEKEKRFIRNYIRDAVIDPIILKDIPKEFGHVDILLLENLVKIFLSQPGQYLSMDELAKDLKRAKKTLYNALFYLEFSFIIRRVLNFRPSLRIASRKLSRIYAYHPALSIPFDIPPEKYIENLVLAELDAKYYWREKEKEVDFLGDNILVEVKYKSKVRKYELKWITYFLKKYGKKLGIKNAYVITKDFEDQREGIYMIPAWQFCFKGISQ